MVRAAQRSRAADNRARAEPALPRLARVGHVPSNAAHHILLRLAAHAHAEWRTLARELARPLGRNEDGRRELINNARALAPPLRLVASAKRATVLSTVRHRPHERPVATDVRHHPAHDWITCGLHVCAIELAHRPRPAQRRVGREAGVREP